VYIFLSLSLLRSCDVRGHLCWHGVDWLMVDAIAVRINWFYCVNSMSLLILPSHFQFPVGCTTFSLTLLPRLEESLVRYSMLNFPLPLSIFENHCYSINVRLLELIRTVDVSLLTCQFIICCLGHPSKNCASRSSNSFDVIVIDLVTYISLFLFSLVDHASVAKN
jgi:hypothetical protein